MARNIQIPLSVHAVLPLGTSAVDVMTGITLKGSGKIVGWGFATDVVFTGTSATGTFNLEIGSTDVTGTATAIVLADGSALGEYHDLGSPTALNEYKDGDTLSIEMAAGGTAFTAGEVTFIIWLQPKTRGI